MKPRASSESEGARAESDLAWLIDWVERAVIRWDFCSVNWPFELCEDARWVRTVVDMAKLELWKIRDTDDTCLACIQGAKALVSFANDIATWRGMHARKVWSCSDLRDLTTLGWQR